MPARTKKRIGLMLDTVHGCEDGIMHGISRWVHTNPGWRVTVFDGERDELIRLAREWDGHGLICTVIDDEFHQAAGIRNLPLVTVGGQISHLRGVSVTNDEEACGKLAADHFMDRGFHRFCFVGTDASEFEGSLATGFLGACQEAEHETSTYAAPPGSERVLAEWLRLRARPLAVLATSDRRAASVLEACHLAGLLVPDDVAVLGMGNHAELCDLCSPPLSSIDCDVEARGLEAAALLSQLMSGQEAPDQPVRIAPAGVVARRSTDTYAFEDPDLSNALRFIHAHAHESIKVKDVLSATTMSRRSLENRFRRHFSRSLHEEIWRVHLERAKELLTTTDLGLKEVAERSGFRTASALANLFKQKTRLTPRKYRAEHRR